MRTNPSLASLLALIQEKCSQSDWKLYLDAFSFQCRVNDLSEKTVTVYAERLLPLARHSSARGMDAHDVTKMAIRTDKSRRSSRACLAARTTCLTGRREQPRILQTVFSGISYAACGRRTAYNEERPCRSLGCRPPESSNRAAV